MGPPAAQPTVQNDGDSSVLTGDGTPSPTKHEACKALPLPSLTRTKTKDVRFEEPSEEDIVENDIGEDNTQATNYDEPPPAPPAQQRKRRVRARARTAKVAASLIASSCSARSAGTASTGPARRRSTALQSQC